jgi:hypothetical protein
MAEFEDTSAALRRLEAALNRIAAQVDKPRPAAGAPDLESDFERAELASRTVADEPVNLEIAAKLDDLIGGLRSALGIERGS